MKTADLDILEKKIGYKFKNIELLAEAITHRSYSNENPGYKANYERLEFLGDSLLGFAAARCLFSSPSLLKEGEMSKYKARLVCEESLCEIARRLGIGEHLLMSKGAAMTGGRDKPSILADAVEAITAAIYLDSDIRSALRFLDENLFKDLKISELQQDDSKSRLQEILALTNRIPEYRLISSSGPDHNKTFRSAVYIDNIEYGSGIGGSKKQSQMEAAKRAIDKINQEENDHVS